MIENDNESAGILEIIADHKITTLIIIGISKSWCVLLLATRGFSSCFSYFREICIFWHRVNRSRRNLAAALQKGTNPARNILFLHNGNLISIRYWIRNQSAKLETNLFNIDLSI